MNEHVNPVMRAILDAVAPKERTEMTPEQYNAHPGITKSAICAARIDADTLSMAAMHASMIADRTDDSETTPSMRWGTLAHAVLLEPIAFAARVAVWREAKRGAAWTAFKAEMEARGRWIVSGPELDKLQAMRTAFQADKDARWILAQCSKFELPVDWTDTDYGAGKGRLDGWGEGCVLEYKTSRNVGKRAFLRSAFTSGYHLGAAWYWHGAGRPASVYVINQQNVKPWSVVSYMVGRPILEAAYEEARQIAVRYRIAEKSGEFPGPYTGIQDFELPAWAADGAEVDVSSGTMEGGLME